MKPVPIAKELRFIKFRYLSLSDTPKTIIFLMFLYLKAIKFALSPYLLQKYAYVTTKTGFILSISNATSFNFDQNINTVVDECIIFG